MENLVYLLDPETTLFRAVELAGAVNIKPISDLLGCEVTQMVRFDESHWLFADEEGLRPGTTPSPFSTGTHSLSVGKSFFPGMIEASHIALHR